MILTELRLRRRGGGRRRRRGVANLKFRKRNVLRLTRVWCALPGSGLGGAEAAAGGDVVLPPTLMNKQDQTALCLTATREWSRHLPVHTVGARLVSSFVIPCHKLKKADWTHSGGRRASILAMSRQIQKGPGQRGQKDTGYLRADISCCLRVLMS